MAGKSGIVVTSNRLPELTRRLPEATRRIIAETAFQIEREAKERAPVDTGNLRRSIHTVIEDGGLSATVGTDVEYAPMVEFGTSRTPARPYLIPAVDLGRRDLDDRARRELEKL